MSSWSWQGAVVALSAGDKYFERARNEEKGDEYCIGDCVRLINERKRVLEAVVTAMWEARDGTKHIECRQLFHELALVRQLQESDAPVVYPAAAKALKIAKVWESNHFEIVPIEWIERKLYVPDANACNEAAAAEADFVAVGFFDENADRLEPLAADSTRLDRNHQLSSRARNLLTRDTETASTTTTGHKRQRVESDSADTLSPEVEMAISRLQAVCQELLLSHAPEQTIAREDERDMIHDQLQTAIISGTSNGALYISGLPGTGKTSIVREVIRQLEMESKHGVIPAFAWTEINGLHLPKPEVAYASIWKVVAGETDMPRSLGPAKLCQFLAYEFEHAKSHTRPTILLVLDEMDFLVTGKSVVLYNILEWQAFKNSKLVVVGIANTMDLPERLEQKVRSRLGSNRLIFSSYTSQQLESIVRQRLDKLDVFSAEAIQICCKFVAQASGDARQALTLCRRAAEVAIERLQFGRSVANQWVVSADDMQSAQSATSVSGPLVRLRDCRKFECVFLIALRMEVKRTDNDAAAFESVLTRFAVLCNTHSLTPVPRLRDLLLICDELCRSGILRQTRTKSSRYPKLMLRCSPQEIYDVFLAHPIGRQLLT